MEFMCGGNGSPLLLLLHGARGGEIMHPALLRARPELNLRHELVALSDRSGADHVDLRAGLRRGREDGRAAFRAKRLLALVSALPGLDIDRGLARGHSETVAADRHDGAKRRARQRLAIGAMTDRGLFRIGVTFVFDEAAMAAALDSHVALPLRVPALRPASGSCEWNPCSSPNSAPSETSFVS